MIGKLMAQELPEEFPSAPAHLPPQALAQSGPKALEAIPLSLWGQCGILVLGSFASMLTATIASVGLPALEHQFHASIDVSQWIASAFLLGLGIAVPLSSWAAARFGVTNLWLGCLALFTIFSVACAVANSMGLLIGMRLALGLVGGLMVPAAQMQVGMLAGPKRVGRVMSILGVPIVVAPAVGVSLGGMLLSQYGWPSLFWINVPLCVVAGVAGLLWLPRIDKKAGSRFDIIGFYC